MKPARSLVLSLVTALAATLGAAGVALPAFAAGPTASFVKTADWGSGWEGKYTITNGGSSTINGWSLAFDLPSGTTLGSYWDALLTSAGQRHTFTNRSWNGTIAPGASVSFGFLASGSGSPGGCQLNGAACGGGTPPTTPPPTTPPPTTPPPTTPPPTDPPTGDLPKHLLTGYWHNFDNPAVELRLRDVPNEYDLVAVAFAEATATPGALTFGIDPGLATALGGYTDADFTADVRTLHSRGKRVILSVGGETGRVTVNNAASATAFADTAAALIARYGFDGIDIDLENGLNPTYMAQALRALRAKVGSSLIIAMAPQTIDMQNPAGGYFKLALDIKDILTVVNTQFYNSGAMLGCDQNAAYGQGTVNFIVALACIQLEAGLRPDQVGLGLPAGPGRPAAASSRPAWSTPPWTAWPGAPTAAASGRRAPTPASGVR